MFFCLTDQIWELAHKLSKYDMTIFLYNSLITFLVL